MSRRLVVPKRGQPRSAPAVGPRIVHVAILAGMSLAIAGAATAEPLRFVSRFTPIPVGAAPQGIAVGDVNGDGHDDVVFTHVGANPTARDSLLHVTLGDGAGGFRQGGDFTVGALPGGVALADVDGDGKLDAVVACSGRGTLAILLGKGDGTFGEMHSLRAGRRPVQVLVRDLDGDGRVDVAAANLGTGEPPPSTLQTVASGAEWSDSSSVTVYLTKPAVPAASPRSGTAGKKPRGAKTSSATQPATAEAANAAGATVDARLFGFGPLLTLRGGLQTIALDGGDLNRDGRTDLVVACRNSQTLRFWDAEPAGGYAPGREVDLGADVNDVVLGDVDRDGALDVVALAVPKPDPAAPGAPNEDRATLLVMLAAQKFALQSLPIAGLAPFRLSLADVNEDGILDVIGLGRGFLCVQRGGGDGTFAAPVPVWLDTGTSFALAKFDGDAHLDIVCGNSRGMALMLVTGNGDGTFGTAVDFAAGTNPAQVLAVDVTGDGRLDLVTADSGGGTISVLAGEPSGRFKTLHSDPASENVSALASGDLDGDGDIDLVTMAVRGRASEIDIRRNGGRGDFAARENLATGLDPAAILLADVNGDRKLDLLVPRANQEEILVYLGRGGAAFQAPQRVPVPQLTTLLAIADLNGDGKQDLVTANARQNTITVLLGKGDATFVSAPSLRSKYDLGSLAVADVNRDGKPDLILGPRRMSATGAVLAGDGDGTFGQRTDFQVGLGCGSLTLVDLDGDGWLDLVCPDAAAGCVTVLHGGPQGLGERADFGTGPGASSTVVADFDGDGKLDVVVANRDPSTLTLLRNLGR
jgi:hypothetical protein